MKNFASIALAILLVTSAGSIGCGATADEASGVSDEGPPDSEGEIAEVAEPLTSGVNIGSCAAIRGNPCATYNLCGRNWCDSQMIWCGNCP